MTDRSRALPRHPTAGAAEGQTFEYRLQRIPVGVVMLDASRRILSANPEARRLLVRGDTTLFGQDILALHPEGARAKVGWLIDQARDAAEGAASLVVTTGFGSLVAKVTRLHGGAGEAAAGYCMMFHALGEGGMGAVPCLGERPPPLLKLPVVRGSQGGVTTLVDVEQVVCLIAEGHYAAAKTLRFSAFCPRSLADLERRLDPAIFLRVHRRHVVNIRHVLAAERGDGRWWLRMADQAATLVPVSRSKVEPVRRLLAV